MYVLHIFRKQVHGDRIGRTVVIHQRGASVRSGEPVLHPQRCAVCGEGSGDHGGVGVEEIR